VTSSSHEEQLTEWAQCSSLVCIHRQSDERERERERERDDQCLSEDLVNWASLNVSKSGKFELTTWEQNMLFNLSSLSETHFNNPSKSLTLLLILTWVDIRYIPLKYVCCGLWISCSNSPNKLLGKEGVYNTVAGWLPTSTPSLTCASSSASARGGSQGSAQMLIIQIVDGTNLTYD